MAITANNQAKRQREYRKRLSQKVELGERSLHYVQQVARAALVAHARGVLDLGQYDTDDDFSILRALKDALTGQEVLPR